jgi:hypothetical protein
MRAIFVLLTLAMIVDADTVLRELARTGMRQKAIDVAPESFSESYLERLSRKELARSPRSNFTQILFYGDRGGPPLPKASHDSYEHWRGLYETLARTPNQIAEAISIGKDAVLRVCDGSGRLSRKVLAGRDPLQIDLGSDRFEIVYLAFTAPGSYILQRVDIYVRTTSPLNTETGLELLRKLQPIFPDLEVSLLVRNDAWFISEPSYPFVNPFVAAANPPTAEEYSHSRTLRCGQRSGSPSCRFK